MNRKTYIDHGVKWGIIMGLIIAVIRNSVWLIDSDSAMGDSATGKVIWWVSILVFIGLVVYIGIKARAITGYITANNAFMALFMAVLVHGVVNVAISSTLIYMNKDKVESKIAERREEMITKWEESGMSDEKVEESIGWFDKFSNPLLATLLAFVAGLAINTIIALIIAQIIKRPPPPVIIPTEAETT
jgi:hypothetical protein